MTCLRLLNISTLIISLTSAHLFLLDKVQVTVFAQIFNGHDDLIDCFAVLEASWMDSD